jgi:hypothetical protein
LGGNLSCDFHPAPSLFSVAEEALASVALFVWWLLLLAMGPLLAFSTLVAMMKRFKSLLTNQESN